MHENDLIHNLELCGFADKFLTSCILVSVYKRNANYNTAKKKFIFVCFVGNFYSFQDLV